MSRWTTLLIAAEPDAETRATMGEIFEALSFVLPLNLSDARFEDPARRKAISAGMSGWTAAGQLPHFVRLFQTPPPPPPAPSNEE